MHRGRRTAVATSEVRDADDRLIALATGSAMLLPGRPAAL
jgi:acyl-coenzyme A thioesterase PaaI-like protein